MSTSKIAAVLHRDRDGQCGLFSCERLKVLKVQGSSTERAHLHGQLLKGPHLSQDVLHYFVGKTKEPLQALPWPLRTLLKKPFVKWLRGLQDKSPSFIREELSILARSAGVSEDDLIMAISGPDLGTLSNAWQMKPSIAWARMRFGCTTVSGRNRSGDFVLARNLDFPGIGRYDTHPLLVIHHPQEKNELKRVAIGADGIHFASISAINERGIGLVVHQNFTNEALTQSVPLLFVGDLILRQARSLDEAETLLRRYPPGPMWTFVLFDVHSGETMAVEASQTRFGLRKTSAGDFFSQTNHCLSEDGKQTQFSTHGTYVNSCRRLGVVDQMSKEAIDSMSLDDLTRHFARILAARCETWAPELSIYDDIIKPITIQSVIFSRSQASPSGSLGQLWVSCDLAPSASGRYVGLDLDSLFGDSPHAELQYEIRDFAETPVPEREHQMRVAQATRLSFDERRDSEALDLLATHRSPGALLMRATLSYRIKRYDEALALTQDALRFELPVHISQSLKWAEALCLLRLGRHSEARSIAQELHAQSPANTFIANAARRLASDQKLGADQSSLIYDFFAGDLVTPPQRQ